MLCVFVALWINMGATLPIPYDTGLKDHSLVVVPSDLEVYVHYAGGRSWEGKNTECWNGCDFLVDLTDNKIQRFPNAYSRPQGSVLTAKFSLKRTYVAIAHALKDDESELVQTSYKEEIERWGEDCPFVKLEIWNCESKQIIDTVVATSRDSFDWSKSTDDLLAYSGFDRLSGGKHVADVWNVVTGERQNITGYCPDFSIIYWVKPDNAIYSTTFFSGDGDRVVWPRLTKTGTYNGLPAIINTSSVTKVFGMEQIGVVPSPNDTYYYGMRNELFKRGVNKQGLSDSSKDERIFTTLYEDEISFGLRWLSDNLFQPCGTGQPIDCLFDCRTMEFRTVEGFPIWVSDDEKTVAYVDKNWKIQRRTLADCPLIPRDPNAPLCVAGETPYCYSCKAAEQSKITEKTAEKPTSSSGSSKPQLSSK